MPSAAEQALYRAHLLGCIAVVEECEADVVVAVNSLEFLSLGEFGLGVCRLRFRVDVLRGAALMRLLGILSEPCDDYCLVRSLLRSLYKKRLREDRANEARRVRRRLV
jgi:hypothetical protein